jgi:hypothetical protein
MRLAEQAGYHVRKIQTLTPNLWVDWQVKLYNYPVREGVTVPFLNGESEPPPKSVKQSNPGTISIIINKFKSKAQRLTKHLHVARIIYLRICDALSQGESYLVFLAKK